MSRKKVIIWLVSLFVSVWFLCNSILLLMTPASLQLIYQLPWIPTDQYGLSRTEQLDQAHQVLSTLYPWNKQIPTLQSLEMTEREIRHMKDVKISLFTTLIIYAGVSEILLKAFFMFKDKETWQQIIRRSSQLTLSIAGVITLGVVFFWNTFFTLFHQVFFPQGNWSFPPEALLIRLFPENLWITYAIVVILVWLGLHLMIYWASRVLAERTKRG